MNVSRTLERLMSDRSDNLFSGEMLIGVGHIGHGALCNASILCLSIPLTPKSLSTVCECPHTPTTLPSIPTGTWASWNRLSKTTSLPLKSVFRPDSENSGWHSWLHLMCPILINHEVFKCQNLCQFIFSFHPHTRALVLNFSFSSSTTNLPRAIPALKAAPSTRDGLTLCVILQ